MKGSEPCGSSAIYFAAEAKAILAVRPELRSADTRSLGEFVACGCVLENRTLFENILLLPGAAAEFLDAAVQAWGSGSPASARGHLDVALSLARGTGHL